MKILLYGRTGWIGNQMLNLFQNDSKDIICSSVRLNDYTGMIQELDEVNPTHVLLCAGLTGRPNVDWCEDNKEQVLNVNVIGTSVLASECFKRNIHLTYFGTGCIYEYDKKHPPYSGKGFKEEDKPNFEKSYYSKTKILTEKILKEFSNVLILRIRMPLSDRITDSRNFITKITKYEKVVNVPNSMTVLTEFLPIAQDMMYNRKIGVYNFTNPGYITHNSILSLYRKHIDNSFTWENFSLEEQSKILKAGRSNNELNVDKLLSEYPEIEHINVAIEKLFIRMKNNSTESNESS